MPLYMDRHDLPGATAAEVAAAHIRDLEVQPKYGVRYISYWYDDGTGSVFCLAEGPSMEAISSVHAEAHGLVANKIIEVDHRAVQQFLGRIYEPAPGESYTETAFRTILFTDIEGSTSLTQQLGDAAAMRVLHTHDSTVRQALTAREGHEVKHTGDGIMAAFHSVARGLEAAIDIQRKLAEHNEQEEIRIGVRIGVSAGEPVTEYDDLFGAVVQLAARLCASATTGGIFVSNAVRELAMGKGFRFDDRGRVPLKGFDEPVQLHEVLWQTA